MKAGVVQARVLEFYLFFGFVLGFLGASDHITIGGHLASGFRVRFLERHKFGIGDFRRHDFFFGCGLDCARRVVVVSGRARALTAASSRTVWHFGQTIGFLLRS